MSATFPSFLIVIFGLMVFGSVMRAVFGGYRPRGRWKFEGLGESREELKRLDAAIAERDVVIEDLQRRLSEMESRLDFTERMLARPSESGAELR